MRGRIVQVREYTDKPNKFLVVELFDDDELWATTNMHYDGHVHIDARNPED